MRVSKHEVGGRSLLWIAVQAGVWRFVRGALIAGIGLA
jgi:hypothetical protein